MYIAVKLTHQISYLLYKITYNDNICGGIDYCADAELHYNTYIFTFGCLDSPWTFK